MTQLLPHIGTNIFIAIIKGGGTRGHGNDGISSNIKFIHCKHPKMKKNCKLPSRSAHQFVNALNFLLLNTYIVTDRYQQSGGIISRYVNTHWTKA